MSVLPQPDYPTGNVLIEEAPVLEPATRRTIITLHCAIGGCGAVHIASAKYTYPSGDPSAPKFWMISLILYS